MLTRNVICRLNLFIFSQINIKSINQFDYIHFNGRFIKENNNYILRCSRRETSLLELRTVLN